MDILLNTISILLPYINRITTRSKIIFLLTSFKWIKETIHIFNSDYCSFLIDIIHLENTGFGENLESIKSYQFYLFFKNFQKYLIIFDKTIKNNKMIVLLFLIIFMQKLQYINVFYIIKI